MKVVSNASPLISLARLGQLDGLQTLFDVIHISTEVHHEVIVAGAGMPGAEAIAAASWIQVSEIVDAAAVNTLAVETGLGVGEVSAVILAQELAADIVLMDERRGRRLATNRGLAVAGCVGILEELFRRGEITDLPHIYRQLPRQGVRIDLATLQRSLSRLNLPPL